MAKNIVVCFDGTWSGVGVDSDRDDVPEETNVLKLYRLLARDTTAAGSPPGARPPYRPPPLQGWSGRVVG